MNRKNINGVGLGLRRDFIHELKKHQNTPIDFLEVAPENWINIGGLRGKRFRYYVEHYPMICHGLSLSLGSPAPLDVSFIKDIKKFLEENNILLYSEHLSYCGDEGQLYDLLPIPMTQEAADYVVRRIKQVQNILEQPLIVENVSYYYAPGQKIKEIDFINYVLNEADCELLLDVNNVYVNSVNHQYDPKEFIQQLPKRRIRYLHIAGHYQQQPNLIIDTHGAAIIDPVWDLLHFTYQQFGVLPTLLERDSNVPSLEELFIELNHIHQIQGEYERRIKHAG